MAENTFCMFLTKILIEVVSGVLIITLVAQLFVIFTDRLFDTSHIILICLSASGLVLSIMAFVGACTENACLCQITLWYCVICLFVNVIGILVCIFSKDANCKTADYVTRSISATIYFLMAMAVFSFIQGIKQRDT